MFLTVMIKMMVIGWVVMLVDYTEDGEDGNIYVRYYEEDVGEANTNGEDSYNDDYDSD